MSISAINRPANEPIGLERQQKLIADDQKNTASKIQTIDEKIRLLDENDKNLKNLYNSLKALKDPNTLYARNVNFGETDHQIFSATVSSQAEVGKHTIAITQLATTSYIQGANNQAAKISTDVIDDQSFETGPLLSALNLTDLKTGTLSISISAKDQNFTPLHATFDIDFSDTLQDIFTKIKQATQGDIVGSYDPISDKMTLTSQSGKDITLGAPQDTSNFWSVTRLFSQHYDLTQGTRPASLQTTSELPMNAVNLNQKINLAGLNNHLALHTGDQTLTINGTDIPYNVANDSLTALIKRIQTSQANAQLTYQRATDQFVFTNTLTGDIDLTLNDTGGLLNALGLKSNQSNFFPGKNAQFNIDNGPILSAHSNTLTHTQHGVQGLELSLKTTGTQFIEISEDTTQAKKSVQDFVEKYNQYTEFVSDKTAIKTIDKKPVKGPLTDRREVESLRNQLRSTITQTQADNPTLKTIEALGLSPSKNNIKDPKLYLNEKLLIQAITQEPQETTHLLETLTKNLQSILEPRFNPLLRPNNDNSIKTSQDALRVEKNRLQEAQNKRTAEIEKLTLQQELQMMQAQEAQQKMEQALTMLQRAQF